MQDSNHHVRRQPMAIAGAEGEQFHAFCACEQTFLKQLASAM